MIINNLLVFRLNFHTILKIRFKRFCKVSYFSILWTLEALHLNEELFEMEK